jgi:hypothetical protein
MNTLRQHGKPSTTSLGVGSDGGLFLIRFQHALRVKAAQYWLALGEVDEALRELGELLPRHWHRAGALEGRFAASEGDDGQGRPSGSRQASAHENGATTEGAGASEFTESHPVARRQASIEARQPPSRPEP